MYAILQSFQQCNNIHHTTQSQILIKTTFEIGERNFIRRNKIQNPSANTATVIKF